MKSILLAAALASTAGGALAQQTVPPGLQQACGADYKKFCASVQPGGGQLIQCFHAHASSLSPQCKAAIADAKAQKDAAAPKS